MAIAAVDSVITDVVLVAEGNRLLNRFEPGVLGLHDPAGKRDCGDGERKGAQQNELDNEDARS
jgi:hypothetical protein